MDEEVTFSLNTETYEYELSQFCDPHQNFRKLKIEGANDKRSQREGVPHFKF